MSVAAPLLKPLDPKKFQDPFVTAKGERRASVALTALRTLWINTGTLCNVACVNCYIESSPKNDALVYISRGEVRAYLDEIREQGHATEEIGLTGGEPFMNPDILGILEDILAGGFRALVLSNAMRPMQRHSAALLALKEKFADQLSIRVSVDHYGRDVHEAERGKRSWEPMLKGLQWLARNRFNLAVAGRGLSGESEAQMRAGYARLFAQEGIALDAADPTRLVLFPEMDERVDVPEITEACWGILHRHPDEMMCATSRMVVKRKGADRPAVVACTLLPYDPQFELGATLRDSAENVQLNHPHCAKFCVLGGASCTAK